MYTDRQIDRQTHTDTQTHTESAIPSDNEAF